MVAYDKEIINVCIVEVNGATVPETLPIEEELNSIYAPAIIQWKVSRIKNFNVNIEGMQNGIFDNTDPDNDMDYTDHENQVYKAFKKHNAYNRNTKYLFFIGGKAKDPNLKGFMPFNRHFGFIFRDQQQIQELIRTIAHELGHGAFRLRHPFSPECPYPQSQGQTNNLMDYVDAGKALQAVTLHKYQWDEVHDWDLGLNWFEGEEEGELMDSYMSKESIKNIIDIIRNDNITNKENSDLSGYALSKGINANLELTSSFTLDYIEVEIKAGKNKGTKENPFLREALKIKPLYLKKEDIDTPKGQEGKFIKVYYNRLDQATIPATGYKTSNDLAISFIIKKSQLDKFKKYLNIEFTVDAIWVSQFNASIFYNCTCFKNDACCFFASQYIVKNSTGLYSPNGNQIATMKFPINNAPLIDMQTPVSIPGGFSQGIAYLNNKLAEDKTTVVGVYYREIQENKWKKPPQLKNL